ncbi:MAG: tetratricopeptide repeat protein [Anaerolineae bacterium]|nr:tetratricopeptide repeat protein [Anaerolineae bacterium]MDQ7033632.1 tetratricopeptide repeat protein [Anaerolineae bacterium]
MRINRNYQTPIFRKRKEKSHVWRNLFFLLLLMASVGIFILRQRPDMVEDATNRLLGIEITPTPAPSSLAIQAQELFWEGKLDNAAALMAEAVEIDPNNISYLYEYGMLLIDLDDGRNGNANQAIDLARQIIQINPNDPRGYALRARGLVWIGNSAGAIPVAQAGLDIAPQFAPLHAAMSRAYIGAGRLREAQEEGIQAIEFAPSDVRSYWAYASSLFFSGARDEAIIEYERTTSVHSGFLPPYFELALLYLASNRDQEAIDTYDRILGVQPSNARALLRQCEAYRKIGQFERALGLCRDSVQTDPEFVPAQYRYGILLYNDFDFNQARDAFQACVELDSGNLECTYRLGLTYYYLAQDDYRINCESQRLSPLDCTSTETCQMGWALLEDSLIMAQTRDNVEADIDIIREGLGAISADPACAGISGRPFPTRTLPPDVTATETPLVTASPTATIPPTHTPDVIGDDMDDMGG